MIVVGVCDGYLTGQKALVGMIISGADQKPEEVMFSLLFVSLLW